MSAALALVPSTKPRTAGTRGKTYLIESGIPIPPFSRAANNSTRGPRCALGHALAALDIGDSVLLDTPEEYRSARGLFNGMRPKRFACRKIPNVGWRLWRTE